MVEIIAQNYTEKSITSESIPFIGMGGVKYSSGRLADI